jgi:hypothetical protein
MLWNIRGQSVRSLHTKEAVVHGEVSKLGRDHGEAFPWIRILPSEETKRKGAGDRLHLPAFSRCPLSTPAVGREKKRYVTK